MDSVGAEVGQKMRSAIKAKLTELDCYVDDELPDYIMVMVANKRSKSQMAEDLQLFLNTKTTVFVEWLHIVLKKLKEVTVTNPDVYKKVAKRKTSESELNMKVKKEKKEKKSSKKIKKEDSRTVILDAEKSLTDDLPVNATNLSEKRKIVIMSQSSTSVNENNFDIPPLSEVSRSNFEELEDIENQIKSVKSRLGLTVDSDNEEALLNIKAEVGLISNELKLKSKEIHDKRKAQVIDPETEEESAENRESEEACEPKITKRAEHARITFTNTNEVGNKKSILDRLGKKCSDNRSQTSYSPKRNISPERTPPLKRKSLRKQSSSDEEPILKRSRFEAKKDDREFRSKEISNNHKHKDLRDSLRKSSVQAEKKSPPGILSRLSLMSKVSIPKDVEQREESLKNKEVQSVVKVKPRVIPPNTAQANKNLLLKAVAEAQRSIAQTPTVGNVKPDALYTKKYREELHEKQAKKSLLEKTRLETLNNENMSSDEEQEYVPQPVKKSALRSNFNYVPSSKLNPNEDEETEEQKIIKQKFIVTLDGIERIKSQETVEKPSVKLRLNNRKTPSPIVFDCNNTSPVKVTKNIPDVLPKVHAPLSLKNKEKCKYWPSCRQGDKCEFFHPTKTCEMFPHCKFGESCLYIHPSCKFGSSCTRRDCPYSHNLKNKAIASRVVQTSAPLKMNPQTLPTCKYFPNCTNINCTFYHPKPCKFGPFCKNQGECNFSHTFAPNKGSLSWKSK